MSMLYSAPLARLHRLEALLQRAIDTDTAVGPESARLALYGDTGDCEKCRAAQVTQSAPREPVQHHVHSVTHVREGYRVVSTSLHSDRPEYV